MILALKSVGHIFIAEARDLTLSDTLQFITSAVVFHSKTSRYVRSQDLPLDTRSFHPIKGPEAVQL
jgi:hypothetical protein